MTSLQAMERDQIHRKLNSRLDDDVKFYAKYCLKIRTKAGEILPFILNLAQERLHEAIEKQKREIGRVRILILKARQQGFSTYTGGRFYHHTTRFSGKATFILSHEADTTEKLFQIVERFHKNCPDAAKMQTDVANRRRMVFSGINSEYFVGTAGNENVGRGGTIQYLHASEAAFYPDGDGFSKGLLQSVPDLPNTEIIIESTANGMDPLFYRMCMDALEEKGDFRLFFSPWFWQEEYRKTPPANFKITEDEAKLKKVYDLDDEQIYWRRNKINEFKGDIKSFMQEYPSNVEEAFITSGDSLISSFKVMEARKSEVVDRDSPLVMGIDPNEAGGRTGIAFRRGRVIEKVIEKEGLKPMELVAYLADLININNPIKCFIDTGNGYGVVDRLVELGFDKIVVGISFNDGAIEDTVYLNKRSEMWHSLKYWIENGGVRIPDNDVLHKEITCVPAAKKTSSGLTKLESKEKIIEDTKIKPDLGDACVLTFAMPVSRDLPNRRRVTKTEGGNKSKLKSMVRRNGLKGSENSSASANLPLWRP